MDVTLLGFLKTRFICFGSIYLIELIWETHIISKSIMRKFLALNKMALLQFTGKKGSNSSNKHPKSPSKPSKICLKM